MKMSFGVKSGKAKPAPLFTQCEEPVVKANVIISGKTRTSEAEEQLAAERAAAFEKLDAKKRAREADGKEIRRALDATPPVYVMKAVAATADALEAGVEHQKKLEKKHAAKRQVKAPSPSSSSSEDTPLKKKKTSTPKKKRKAKAPSPSPSSSSSSSSSLSSESPKKEKKKAKTPAPKKKQKKTRKAKDAGPSHAILDALGNFARTAVATHVWGTTRDDGQKKKPHPEDHERIAVMLDGANKFFELGIELKKQMQARTRALFDAADNTSMDRIVARILTVPEMHMQPTVRKQPTPTFVDSWTGDTLVKSDLRKVSGLIFHLEDTTATPNMVINRKVPATVLSLMHFMAFFSDYCKVLIQEALVEFYSVEFDEKGIARWDDVWVAAAGEALAERAVVNWPKSGNSVTPFTKAVVRIREMLKVCLIISDAIEVKVNSQQ